MFRLCSRAAAAGAHLNRMLEAINSRVTFRLRPAADLPFARFRMYIRAGRLVRGARKKRRADPHDKARQPARGICSTPRLLWERAGRSLIVRGVEEASAGSDFPMMRAEKPSRRV